MAGYSDFTNNMFVIPGTGDLGRLTQIEAVKNAVRNLLLTNRGERLMNPDKGASLSQFLFEHVSPITATSIRDQIENTLESWEPRIKINEVLVTPMATEDGYDISLLFNIINIPDQVSLQLFLTRTR
jgi:phage baseplate assembly protein W